jgi:hypothetical protein
LDGTPTSVSLGLDEARSAIDGLEGSDDPQLAGIPVDVPPLEAKQLALTQSLSDCHRVQVHESVAPFI